MRLLYVVALTALSTVAARADISRADEAWTVRPDFEKNADAREALSGAACVTGTNHCFAVNDEKKYAQFFDIEGRNVAPKELIRLLPDKIDGVKMDEIDAEGVAYVPARTTDGASYYYVTGSHGLSRKGELQPSRFFLLRFPVDPSTGRPTFAYGDSDAAPEISKTDRLRDTIKNTPDLSAHAEQRLDRNGVTIEGLAVSGEDALFGLRSPCVSMNAYVMRVPLGDLFKDSVPVATTSTLALGDNAGIRDLAKVKDGVLILSGRSDDERGDQKFTCEEERPPSSPLPSVWFWSGKHGDAAKPLGPLPGVAATDSAETLLVLDESTTAYRVLVLFDGVANGKPVEFNIRK